jgi:hypothetical protein
MTDSEDGSVSIRGSRLYDRAMHFRLVDPTRNRFRSYSMTEQATLFGGADLVITWGANRLATAPPC